MTELVFNELSMERKARDIWTAREWMNALVRVIKHAARKGFDRQLRVTGNIFSKELAQNYTINNWLSDRDGDREKQGYLRGLLSKVSHIEVLQEKWLNNEGLSTEFICGDSEARGLGYAYLIDGMALSLHSEDQWNRNVIGIIRRELEEDTHLHDYQEEVIHACREEHIDENRERVKALQLLGVKSGRELWERRRELFPSLDFCLSTDEQIISLCNPMLCQIKKKLSELDQHAADGQIDPTQFASEVSRESTTRLSQYDRELTHVCPDGVARKFNWHMRATPGPWRIYFEHQGERRRFFIAYVGLKFGI